MSEKKPRQIFKPPSGDSPQYESRFNNCESSEQSESGSKEDAQPVEVLLVADELEESEPETGIELFGGDVRAAYEHERLLAKLEDLGIDAEALREFCRDAGRFPSYVPTVAIEQTAMARRYVDQMVTELIQRGMRVNAMQQALEQSVSDLSRVEDYERKLKHGQSSDEKTAGQQPGTDSGDKEASQEKDT